MKRPLIFAAGIALASAAQAASTGNDIVVVQDAPTARVSYAGLDLASAAGREQLAGRIESAASLLCLEGGVEPLAVATMGTDYGVSAVARVGASAGSISVGHYTVQSLHASSPLDGPFYPTAP